MVSRNKKIFLSFFVLFLISFFFIPISGFSTFNSYSNDQPENNLIPFDNLYFQYTLKGNINNTYPFTANLIVNYAYVKNSTQNTDFQQKMVLQSFFLQLLRGESQENATFAENSTTRNFQLIKTEGYYIQWLIYYVTAYNTTKNASNWDPFWIYPQYINSSKYPIYSFYFNLTGENYLGHSDLALFNNSRPVLIFKGYQYLIMPYENITNNFGLIYDNTTGVLVKGVLSSTIAGTSEYEQYYANFELDQTNIFSVFSTTKTTTNLIDNIIPTQIQHQLQQPNYFMLSVIIAFPILLTLFRFLRIKEITGGMD